MTYTYRQLQQLLKVARNFSLIPQSAKLNAKTQVLLSLWCSMTSDERHSCEDEFEWADHSHQFPEVPEPEVIQVDNDDFLEGAEFTEADVKYNRKLNKPRRSGIEFEFTSPVEYETIMQALRDADLPIHPFLNSPELWVLKGDCSIHASDNKNIYGYELVTPPLNLESSHDREEVRKFLRVLKSLGCKVNDTTGTHVHLEASDMTREQMVRYFQVWQALETKMDSMVDQFRRGDLNEYCHTLRGVDFSRATNLSDIITALKERRAIVNGSPVDEADYDYYVTEMRYHKLNPVSFLSYGTLEVRHHEGTLQANKILNYARYQMQVMVYSMHHSVEDTIQHFS